MSTLVRTLLALGFAVVMAVSAAGPALAQVPTPIGAGPLAKGTVVSLKGTPHLFFADENGTLHWASDTRALANRGPIPSARSEVTLQQLRALPVGDPWLSTGAVKIGDAIYVVKWDTSDPAPTLLHVQSANDLPVLGITGSNVGTLVQEKGAWERQFGQSTDKLIKAELASPGALSTPDTWTAFTSRAGGFAVLAPSFTPPAQPAPTSLPGGQFLPADLHLYVFSSYLDGPAVLYVAGSGSLPQEALDELQQLGPDLAFEAIRSGILTSDTVDLLSYRSITQGIYVGRELSLKPKIAENLSSLPSSVQSVPVGTIPDVVVTLRVFLVRDKLFAAGAVNIDAMGGPGLQGAPADVGKFLDSFAILPSAPAQ